MTWKAFLNSGKIARHTTSSQEMDSLRAMVQRDLQDAGIAGLSADRSFGIAYGAVLILAKMVIAAAGYRVKGEGGHRTTFDALLLAMGPQVKKRCSYFDTCRRKRNKLDYDAVGGVSDSEARELRKEARAFQELLGEWLKANHPHLV